MKTRNYKPVPLGSTCHSNQGIWPYSLGIYANPDPIKRVAESGIKLNTIDKKADRVRRRCEKKLDWDAVRELMNEGLTLEQAKKESQW